MLKGLLIGGVSALSLAFLFIASASLLLPPPGSGPQRIATGQQPSLPVLRDQSEAIPRVPERPSAPRVAREPNETVVVGQSAVGDLESSVAAQRRAETLAPTASNGALAASGINLPAGSEFNRRAEDGAARTPGVDSTPRVVAVVEGFGGDVATATQAPVPQTRSAARPDEIEISALSAPPGSGAAPVLPERQVEGVPRTFGRVEAAEDVPAPSGGESDIAIETPTEPPVEIASDTAPDLAGDAAPTDLAAVARDEAIEPAPENPPVEDVEIAEADRPEEAPLSDVAPTVEVDLVASLTPPVVTDQVSILASSTPSLIQPVNLVVSRDMPATTARDLTPSTLTSGGGAPQIVTVLSPPSPSDLSTGDLGTLPSDVGIVLVQESAPKVIELPRETQPDSAPSGAEPPTIPQPELQGTLDTDEPVEPVPGGRVFEITEPVLPDDPATEPLQEQFLDADGNPIRPRRIVLDSERASGLPIGEGEIELDDADDDTPPEGANRALERNAAAFENPSDLPLLSVVLLFDADTAFDAAALADMGVTATFAVDPSAPDIAADVARLREAGHEVIWQAAAFPVGVPQDLEVAIGGARAEVPEVTGVIDTETGAFARDRFALAALLPVLDEAGLGFLAYSDGLNSGVRSAERAGVAATTIYRDLDGNNERASIIVRSLDRATLEAAQTGAVVVSARASAEVMTALTDWVGGDRAGLIAFAPLSAVLRSNEES